MLSRLLNIVRLGLTSKQSKDFWIFSLCYVFAISCYMWIFAHTAPTNFNNLPIVKILLIVSFGLATLIMVLTELFYWCMDHKLFYLFCAIYALTPVLLLALIPSSDAFYVTFMMQGALSSTSVPVVKAVTQSNAHAQRLLQYFMFLAIAVMVVFILMSR